MSGAVNKNHSITVVFEFDACVLLVAQILMRVIVTEVSGLAFNCCMCVFPVHICN